MNRDQLIKDLDTLITKIEKIKSDVDSYKESYSNWLSVMQSDIDSEIASFETDLEKELGDIE